MSTGALARLIRRTAGGPRAPRRCDLCGAGLGEDHRHVLDLRENSPLCACRACSVLFQRDAAGAGRYRLVPDRRVRLAGLSPADLGVPVGLAFFVRHADGRVVAHYPSPAGATRWEIDPEAWAAAVRRCPALAGLAADVEALLVDSARGRAEAWLVPVDDCHRLVALVRRHWSGMSGGDAVWREIERFFDELRRCHGTDPDRPAAHQAGRPFPREGNP